MKNSDLPSKTSVIHQNPLIRNTNEKKTNHLRNQIDAMLMKDYSIWNSNPNEFNVLNTITAKNSQIFQSYIKEIYHDYKIKDPLQKKKPHHKGLQLVSCLKQKKQRFSQSQQQSGKRNVFINIQSKMFQHKVHFIDRTALSYDSMAPSNQEQKVLHSVDLAFSGIKNNADRTRDSFIYNSRFSIPSKNINQEIINKDLFSSKNTHQVYEEVNPEGISYVLDRPFFNRRNDNIPKKIKRNAKSLLTEKKSSYQKNYEQQLQRTKKKDYASYFINLQQRRKLFQPDEKINQSFRYCVGCESAILEANIHSHQEQCFQFKRISSLMGLEQMIIELDKKIKGIIDKVHEKILKINHNDSQNIIQSSKTIANQVSQSIKILPAKELVKLPLFKEQYYKIINIGTNWGLLTEEVNKLKWFLLVKENFQYLKTQGENHFKENQSRQMPLRLV